MGRKDRENRKRWGGREGVEHGARGRPAVVGAAGSETPRRRAGGETRARGRSLGRRPQGLHSLGFRVGGGVESGGTIEVCRMKAVSMAKFYLVVEVLR